MTKLFDCERLSRETLLFSQFGERKDGLPETIQPMLFHAGKFQGRDSEIFAYYGKPKRSGTQKLPAILLIHGGEGRAYDDWVQLWTDRGFAALAIDVNAHMYTRKEGDLTANPKGGPKGYGIAGFDIGNYQDCWTYYTVANLIRAVTFLCADADVDAKKITVSGISWGGFLTYILMGLDKRVACASVIYTTAYLFEDPFWQHYGLNETMGQEKLDFWQENFDPKNYIPDITAPMLWVRGHDDTAFSAKLVDKTKALFRCPLRLFLRQSMVHDQYNGSHAKEIYPFVKEILKLS